MATPTETEAAARAYDEAHTLHYRDDKLLEALLQYRQLIRSHPDSAQAAHSRTQIGNITRRVVPEDKLVDAQVALVSELLEV